MATTPLPDPAEVRRVAQLAKPSIDTLVDLLRSNDLFDRWCNTCLLDTKRRTVGFRVNNQGVVRDFWVLDHCPECEESPDAGLRP